MTVDMNNRLLLVDYHSFGSINYYSTLIKYDRLKIELYEHFRKGSYASRYCLAGPNGKILLSIPVVHGHRDRTPLASLRIANRDRWQTLHWRTLTSAYRRSPWFEFYEEELRPLYTGGFEYLLDWNRAAFGIVTKWLNLSWDISATSEYQKHYPEADVDDKRYLVMPGKGKVKEEYAPLVYRQVFEDRTGFIPGLSILDLLFCEGKRARSLLEASPA